MAMEELRKVDVRKMDQQLERHLYRLCALNQGAEAAKVVSAAGREYRQIDARKLTVKKQLGKGTSATVYKAFLDGQLVAVKVFDGGVDNWMTEDQKAYCCKEEVSIWHNLSHPNIIKFVGAAKNSELMIPSKGKRKPKKASFMVAEYMSGGSLKSYLIKKHKWKLPFNVFIRFALDLAKGLCYLHSKRIAHRDIKTENLLIDEKTLTLKLADFGVACVEPPYPSQISGFIGTLGYMAPEVLNRKPYSKKCDVYSFGICLLEMYCCNMPCFNRKPVLDINSAIANQDERPRIPKQCPRAVADIMMRCWEADPSKRPEMPEVVRMLEAVAETTLTSKGMEGCFCFLH